MRHFNTYLLIGLLSITSTISYAQAIDTNRMNRDISIMENILEELFRTQIKSNSDRTLVVSKQNFFFSNGVRGAYLPGFGLIFMISSPSSYTVLSENVTTSGYSVHYTENGADSDSEADQESITERITDFLKNYGSTIGQLKNEDKILVIYGSKNSRHNFVYRLSATKSNIPPEKDKLPVISVSANVKDLADYRTGKLKDSDLSKRIAVATSEDKEYFDLKVLGNIFENALNEREENTFRLSGSVNYLMLDNFGALYSFDIRYSNRSDEHILWDFATNRRSRAESIVVGQANNNDRSETQEELNEKIKDAYAAFLANIKEYMIDYGRTLSSLNNNQYLLLSVSVNGRFENVPDRLDLQIKKSVLEQVDRGNINREKAIQEIIVTEY